MFAPFSFQQRKKTVAHIASEMMKNTVSKRECGDIFKWFLLCANQLGFFGLCSSARAFHKCWKRMNSQIVVNFHVDFCMERKYSGTDASEFGEIEEDSYDNNKRTRTNEKKTICIFMDINELCGRTEWPASNLVATFFVLHIFINACMQDNI